MFQRWSLSPISGTDVVSDANDQDTWGCIQKFLHWPHGARTANDTALCHYAQLYCYFVSHSSGFCPITVCVASQWVFIVVTIYFVTDSVQKLLDTALCYMQTKRNVVKQSSIPKDTIRCFLALCDSDLKQSPIMPLTRMDIISTWNVKCI